LKYSQGSISWIISLSHSLSLSPFSGSQEGEAPVLI
jgi:hypothetical protein